jgi:hypothetical protein
MPKAWRLCVPHQAFATSLVCCSSHPEGQPSYPGVCLASCAVPCPAYYPSNTYKRPSSQGHRSAERGEDSAVTGNPSTRRS